MIHRDLKLHDLYFENVSDLTLQTEKNKLQDDLAKMTFPATKRQWITILLLLLNLGNVAHPWKNENNNKKKTCSQLRDLHTISDRRRILQIS